MNSWCKTAMLAALILALPAPARAENDKPGQAVQATRVTQMRPTTVDLMVFDGTAFQTRRQVGGGSLPMPLQVLRRTDTNYVQVEYEGARYWIKPTAIKEIQPRAMPQGKCSLSDINKPPGDVTNVARGSGEAC